jgi:hypothetical protein
MLWATRRFLENEQLKVPAEFERLIISLRTAKAYDGKFDKAATEFDDSLESLNLRLKGYCYQAEQQHPELPFPFG